LTSNPTTEDVAPQRAKPDASILGICASITTFVLGAVAINALEYSTFGKTLVVTVILAVSLAAVVTTLRGRLRKHLSSAAANIVLALLWTFAILLAGIAITSTSAGWPTNITDPVDAAGHFDEPDERDTVPTGLTLSGTATIPNDMSLWLLIEPPDNLLHTTTPHPLRIQQHGLWEVQGVGIGRGPRDIGNSFRFVLVAVPTREDPIARALADLGPDEGSSTVVDPGAGAQELDSVRVTLGAG